MRNIQTDYEKTCTEALDSIAWTVYIAHIKAGLNWRKAKKLANKLRLRYRFLQAYLILNTVRDGRAIRKDRRAKFYEKRLKEYNGE